MKHPILSAVLFAFCIPSAFSQNLLDALVAPGTQAVVLGEGYGFCEGPAADALGNIYFSDGAKDTIHFYPYGQAVQKFADSLDANGMMFNSLGELGVCEGAAFQVVAFNPRTKKKRSLISNITGERAFNEPNDLTFDATNGFYFTDPNYKHRGQETLRKEDVYYVSNVGEVSCVSTVCKQPNGILLTPDDKFLYVADCAGKLIYRYKVDGPGELSDERLWIDIGAHPDGMTLDTQGNLYLACGPAGVLIYDKEGKKIGTLSKEHGIPYASNCVFGGPNFSILYMTSVDKFLGIPTKTTGIRSRHVELVP
ncbi:MAG: SMP-30/gluconolactonase/LRE family protein [Planctomycetaceae bacterium]|nr:SMP-30/gluconolactonase/LRE family protein [Planctomycetaceae bacterium]